MASFAQFGNSEDGAAASTARPRTRAPGAPFRSPAAAVAHYERLLAERDRQHERLVDDNRHAQAELFKARILCDQATDQASRRTEFLALVAHELRSPLASLSTAALLLGRPTLTKNQIVALQKIVARQTEHASRLIEDLMDLSRARTGKLSLRMRPVDMREAIELAVDACMPAIRRRCQRFDLDVVAGRLFVEGDQVRLVQVLCNLLDNASKYTPEQGSISLLVSADETFMELRVEDSGIGMRAELLPTLFDAFVQGPEAVSFNDRGLGIGLAVVRELVAAHCGTLEVASAGPGRGSRFVVRLARLGMPPLNASPVSVIQE